MSDDEMARAHREDSAYQRACEDAARLIGTVLNHPRMAGRIDARKCRLWAAQEMLEKEAAHIVAVWD